MTLSLKCRCGAVRGLIENASASTGLRMVCYCDDCQAYPHFLGRANETLDENGGTEIFAVTPAHLKITEGADHIRCLRLTSKGLMRWYAGCCKTPIANSPPSARLPYHGVVHTVLGPAPTCDAALGPVRARLFGKYGKGNLPPGTPSKISPGSVLPTLSFILKGWLKGQQSPSPFFASDGKPVVAPYVLTPSERQALRPPFSPQAPSPAV